MSARRLALLAWLFAATVQGAMVAAYSQMTDGCFCQALVSPPLPIPAPHVMWFFQSASWSMGVIPTIPVLDAWEFNAAPWFLLVVYAAINSVLWFGPIFILLNGVVLACRARLSVGRVALLPRGELRARWPALVLVIVGGIALGSGAMYRRWWLASAERIARETIRERGAARPGAPPTSRAPNGVPTPDRVSDYAGPYTLVLTDTRWVGHDFLDNFVPPTAWIAEARFPSGFRRELTVTREAGDWKIDVGIPFSVSAFRRG